MANEDRHTICWVSELMYRVIEYLNMVLQDLSLFFFSILYLMMKVTLGAATRR